MNLIHIIQVLVWFTRLLILAGTILELLELFNNSRVTHGYVTVVFVKFKIHSEQWV